MSPFKKFLKSPWFPGAILALPLIPVAVIAYATHGYVTTKPGYESVIVMEPSYLPKGYKFTADTAGTHLHILNPRGIPIQKHQDLVERRIEVVSRDGKSLNVDVRVKVFVDLPVQLVRFGGESWYADAVAPMIRETAKKAAGKIYAAQLENPDSTDASIFGILMAMPLIEELNDKKVGITVKDVCLVVEGKPGICD
ncbi:hypothetical protein [Pseudomonas putida]|uniref:Band 7 domain-containing protein n=1 Tax=Pseudomonas putida TaxID=303 RepID=A0A8I1JJ33_PSEPU|nr:hypothetical protein [Pseudomonas putida]MBI6883194.1 hypothetical protein [Pseudomonas putida]